MAGIYGKLQLCCAVRASHSNMAVRRGLRQWQWQNGMMMAWAHIQFIIKLYGIWRRQTVASG